MSTSLGWTELGPVSGQSPSARSGHTITAHCSDKRQFVLFGGIAGNRRNDIYTLTEHHSGQWLWKAPQCRGNMPPPLCNHSAWSVSVERPKDGGGTEKKPCLFVYGGQDDKRQSLGDVFMLDLQTFSWRRLYVSAPVPPPREWAAVAWCNSAAWVFGGRSGFHGQHQDLWRLDISACRYNEGIDVGGAVWEEILGTAPTEAVDDMCSLAGSNATLRPSSVVRPSSAARAEWRLSGSAAIAASNNGTIQKSANGAYSRPGSAATNRSGRSATLGSKRLAQMELPWPSGRHRMTFVPLGEATLYCFGGLTGAKGQEVPSAELWALDTKTRRWWLVDAHGRCPAARFGHALWAVSPNELAVWGGFVEAHKFAPLGLHILDLEHRYWSTPFVNGTPFPPRASYACSSFTNNVSVFFGGTPLEPLLAYNLAADERRASGLYTDAQNSVWLMHTTSRSVGTGQCLMPDGGVTMNMGPERALVDTEMLLKTAKSENLSLQRKLLEVLEDVSQLDEELSGGRDKREGDQHEIEGTTSSCRDIALALQGQRALTENMMRQVSLERKLRQRSADLLRAFQNAVAASEAMLLERDTGNADAVEDPATRKVHYEQLMILQQQLDRSGHQMAEDQSNLVRLEAEYHTLASEQERLNATIPA